MLWFRDSSFVAVEKVKVEGAVGPQAGDAVRSLTASAKKMSTLHVDRELLHRSVADLSTVSSLSVSTDFPHAMTITINPKPPAAIATSGGHGVVVARDGRVLAGLDAKRLDLPLIRLSDPLSGDRLDGKEGTLALVAGSAPEAMRPVIESVAFKGEHGIEAELRGGIPVIFGTADRAARKWSAVAATLADPDLTALTYLDVRVPSRPAVGGAGESAAIAPISPDPGLTQ